MERIHRRPAWNRADLDAPLSTLILACLVAIVCYMAARLVFVLGIPPDHLASFWPSTAFLVAALLLVQRKIWPVLIVAGLGAMALADLENGVPIRFEIWITLGNLAEVIVATLGIRRLLAGVPHLSNLKTLAKYLLFAVILVPFVSALVGANASATGGYMLQWRLWFFADALAFLTVLPAILNWVRDGREWSRRPYNYLEFGALMTLLVLFGYLAFMGTGQGVRAALLYSLVPLLLWAALRLGLKGVSTSMVIVALLAIWGAAHGRGLFSEQGPLNDSLSLQLFLFFAAIPFTVLAVLVEEQERAQQVLIEEEAQLSEAQHLAQMGSWQWEPKTDAVTWSKEIYRISGYDPNLSPPTFKDHKQFFTLESWDRLYRSAEHAIQTGEPYALDLEGFRLDGTRLWMTSRGEAIRDASNQPVLLRGTIENITERKRAENTLRESEERFRLAAQAGKMFAYEWDVATDVIVRSGESAQILGIDEATPLSGQQVLARVHPDDREGLLAAMAGLGREKPHLQVSYRMVRPDGTVIWVERNSRAHFDKQGMILRVVGMVVDVTERKVAERELTLVNDRLRLAMEAVKSVGWDRDVRTGRDTLFGDLQDMFGIPSEVYDGRVEDFHRYIHPEDRRRVMEAIDDAMECKKPYAAEFRILRPDGIVRWVGARGKFYYSLEGEPERMLGMALDITERKLVEEALRESEERLRLAAQAGKMYAFDWDVVTDVIIRSEEGAHIFGLDSEQANLTKQQLLAGVHPEDRATFVNSIAERTPESPNTQISYRLLRPDGSILWLERTGHAFFDEQGKMVRMIGMVADITERKLAEEALRQKEAELSEAQRLAQVGSWQWEPLTDTVTWSRELYRIVGRDPNLPAASYKEHSQILTAESWERLQRSVEEALRSGTPYELDLEYVRPDGSTIWARARGEAQRDITGHIVGLRGTAQDITERRLAERELTLANERLRLAMEAGKSVGWQGDVRTRRITWYGDLKTIFGMPLEKFVGDHEDFFRRVHPEDQPRVREVVKDAMQTKRPYAAEFRTLWPDGTVRWVAAKGKFYYSPGGEPECKLGITVDITERKLMEVALRESEERLRLAAQVGRMFAYDWDVATDVTIRSEEAAHILGLPGGSIRAIHGQVLASVHPEDRAKLIGSIAALTPESPNFRTSFRFLRPDGSVLWLERTGHAFFDEEGRMVRMIGMVADVNERKLAEEALARVGGRLIEAHEEERTWIARELHDDIGQQLALLANNLALMEQEFPDSAPEIRNRVREQLKCVHDISADVQAISHRLHSSKLRYLGIVAAAKSFCQELSEQHKVEIDFTHADVPPTVPDEISLCLFRVMQEALHNAVKHSGVRHIEVELRGASDGIDLTVRDSGLGFDTEAAMYNRGLGLVSMQERINLVNGTFSIDSRPGCGTTIHARLPLSTIGESARAAGG
jgi:PAS domain S-box-containing protein